MKRQREIKVKPVSYGGIQFRSTLEARWAIFFDAAGIAWRYEPKYFDLPSGKYLPDFWLPHLHLWAEVKPFATPLAILKLVELVEEAGHVGLLLEQDTLRVPDGPRGNINDDTFVSAEDGPYLVFRRNPPFRHRVDRCYLFADCPACGHVHVHDNGFVYHCTFCNITHNCETDPSCAVENEEYYGYCRQAPTFDSPKIRGAFQCAQRYRF